MPKTASPVAEVHERSSIILRFVAELSYSAGRHIEFLYHARKNEHPVRTLVCDSAYDNCVELQMDAFGYWASGLTKPKC